MRKYPNAADGLKLMFYAQIIVIVGAVLSLVPVLGSVIVIVGSIVSLVGLYKTQADDSGYQMAFYVTIASIVVGVIKNFAGNGIFGSLVGIVNTVLNLAIIYYVCTTTSNLLHSVGNEALANRGITVWKIYLVVTIIAVVCSVVAYIPVLNIIASVVVLVAAIVTLVGYILYLMFLNGSYKAL